jgi:hypothetical protein
MDRGAFTVGAKNSHSSVLDRFAKRELGCAEDRTGDSSFGTIRTEAVLPRSAAGTSEDRREEEASKEQEIVLHEIWSQLSLLERQRFGHCFSFMVLKALGLRPCRAQEVQS